MKSTANIALFHPEEKWTALSERQQFGRSVLVHFGCLLVLLGAVATYKPEPRHGESRSLYINFDISAPKVVTANADSNEQTKAAQARPTEQAGSFVFDETDHAARTPLNQTNSIKPVAALEKPPEVSVASTRSGAPVKEILKQGENLIAMHQPGKQAVTVNSAASSPKPSEQTVGPKGQPQSGTTATGSGAPTSGGLQSASSHATNTTVVDPTVSKNISPSGRIPQNGTPGSAGSGSETVETFAELDRIACSAFYQGEAIGASDPEKSKELYQKSFDLMQRAIPLLEREQGKESNEMAQALSNTGRCLIALKDFAAAESYFMRAAAYYEKTGQLNAAEYGTTLVYLADALTNQKKFMQAEKPLTDSVEIYKKFYGEHHQYVSWIYLRLAQLCSSTGREPEAQKYRLLAKQ